MTERPILFSTEMVKAILEGRKTVTRRPIRPQPPANNIFLGWCISTTGNKKRIGCAEFGENSELLNGDEIISAKPHYDIGDHLWVRETWHILPNGKVGYRASYETNQVDNFVHISCWKPSIHMPRWASRIMLEVVDVRAERLQEITEGEVAREGWFFQNHDMHERYDPVTMDTARQWFRGIWDTTYSKRGFSWDSNPWVWRIEFRVI